MPAPQLEQQICNWVEEPRREVGSTPRKDLLEDTVVSALKTSAEGTPYIEAYPAFHFGFRCPRYVANPEQDVWALAHAARMKVARDALNDAADILAAQLNITRSQLYSMALDAFIEKYKEEKLLRELNEAYSGGMEPEEKEFMAHAKDYHRRRLSNG